MCASEGVGSGLCCGMSTGDGIDYTLVVELDSWVSEGVDFTRGER